MYDLPNSETKIGFRASSLREAWPAIEMQALPKRDKDEVG
jgi:hypothetical protein